MKRMVMGFVGLALLLSCGVALGETRIRAYGIRQDSVDYIFTAVVIPSETNSLLSFNTRSGRTRFVRVGEQMDEYTIKTCDPADGGRVTLEHEDGQIRTLETNELVTIPGLRTGLVVLGSGKRTEAREGDTVTVAGRVLTVEEITQDTVTVVEDGVEKNVPMMTQEERAKVTEVIKIQVAARIEAQRQLELAAQKRAEEAAAERKAMLANAAARREKARARMAAVSTPQCRFTTTYRYPTEWDVIAPPRFDQNGRMISSAVVVPTAFEEREVGPMMSVRALPFRAGAYGASGISGRFNVSITTAGR